MSDPSELEYVDSVSAGHRSNPQMEEMERVVAMMKEQLAALQGSRQQPPPQPQPQPLLQPRPQEPILQKATLPLPESTQRFCSVVAQRIILVLAIFGVVSAFLATRMFSGWGQELYFNITSESHPRERIAYDFMERFGREPASEYSARIKSFDKIPRLYQIKTADQMLQMFDKEQGMIRQMLNLLKTHKAQSVSSYHVIHESKEDEMPDFLILDTKYKAPRAWWQFVLVWASDAAKRNFLGTPAERWIALKTEAYAFNWKHVERLVFLFGPKIAGVGQTTLELEQLGSMYEASQKKSHKYHDMIFVDALIPYPDVEMSSVRLEKVTGLMFTGSHAWAIQRHIETTTAILNTTTAAAVKKVNVGV